MLSQFSENGKELTDLKRNQFKQTVSQNFKDLVYHCMLVLRSEDETLTPYQNQTTFTIKKIGIRRLRTMELLKNLFALISKHDEIKECKKV